MIESVLTKTRVGGGSVGNVMHCCHF